MPFTRREVRNIADNALRRTVTQVDSPRVFRFANITIGDSWSEDEATITTQDAHGLQPGDEFVISMPQDRRRWWDGIYTNPQVLNERQPQVDPEPILYDVERVHRRYGLPHSWNNAQPATQLVLDASGMEPEDL